MELITLYSTNCPKCKIISKKLMQAGISFNIVDCKENTKAIDMLSEKGFRQMPILQVGDKFLDFKQANTWINEGVK